MGKLMVEAEGMLITEPTSRETANGGTVWQARFSVTERKKNKDTGQYENGKSIIFTVVDFNENLGSFVKKDIVVIKGRVSMNTWTDREGLEREELKLFADSIEEYSQIPRV